MIKAIEEWEVWTPTGWSDFSGIKETEHDSSFLIKFDDDIELECSISHPLKKEDGNFAKAEVLIEGDILFEKKKIKKKQKLNKKIKMYDLLNVEKNHEYYTNNIVSHNCAHVDNMSEIWEAAYPAISAGGKVISQSTPKGTLNWFHKTCIDAKSGLNDFVLTTLLWDVHPERDDEWFRDQTKNLDARSIAQEFLCSFNASGDTVIDPEARERMRKDVKEPMYKIGIDRNYWIWEEMRPDGKYLISCDVARGDGEDYSAISVQEMQDMKRVAEYKGKQDRDLFVQMIQKVAREYGNPLQIVEVNNIGISVAEDLYETGYENLYFCKKGSQEYIDPIQAIGNSNAVPGFTTTQKNRTLIIAKLEEYIRNGDLINYSERFLDELSTFIWKNGRPEAQKGYNDDLIMSMAIACWVRDTAQVKGTREAAYNSAQLDAIVFTRKEFTSGFPGERNIYHSGRRLETEIDEMKRRVPLIFLG